jgi:hypothetical protein
MKPETLAALKESIKHWERLATGKRKENESIFYPDCALCSLFYHNEPACVGCPVMEATGKEYCQDSPWLEVRRAYENYGHDPLRFYKTATRELEFLKSLLPKE